MIITLTPQTQIIKNSEVAVNTNGTLCKNGAVYWEKQVSLLREIAQTNSTLYTGDMKITKTLFLTLLSIASLIILVNLALARWSFDLGFREFIGGIEKQRLTRLSKVLVKSYQENGNSWQDIDLSMVSFSGANYGKGRRPPPHHGRFKGPSGGLDRPPHRRGDGPPHRRDNPPPPHHPNPMVKDNLGPDTALFDNDDVFVAGTINRSISQSVTFDIEIDGKKVGYLQSWPLLKTEAQSASQFAQQQFTASVVIAIVSLLLAGLISWLVSRRLLKPVKQILSGVSDLSEGNYQVSFKQRRKDEIGQLMSDIESLSQTLEQNRSAKNRWFANISHELRTPITVLQGEIEVLKAGIRPLNMEQVYSFEQEVELLRRLVEDLYQLSMSDIGALRYQFSPLNISDCVQSTAEGFESLAVNKQIEFTLEVTSDLSISADKQRLEQLLLNLLTNSFAYTDSGGKIKVKLEQNAQTLMLTVTDSAPGLPPEECELMFEPLYRHDSSRKMRESGAGLGLSICKNIVEAHQGSISARPSELGGICVTASFKANWKE